EKLKAGLGRLAFEERLGSMADRADRIAAIVRAIALSVASPGPTPETTSEETPAPLVALSDHDRDVLVRAAELAKFDLASQMVIELTSLAGVMAREYARRAGESEAVSQALFEMELPRSAGGVGPATAPGALLALADRLDLLVGLFGVGATPTGSSDPFGLRRAALGVVAILRAFPTLRNITLGKGLAVAAEQFGHQRVDLLDTAVADAREFIVRRYEQQLLDAGHPHQFVAAVLPLAEAPAAADEALAELIRRAGNPEFADLVAALQRVRRIVPAGTVAGYQPSKLSEPTEVALHDALRKVAAVLPEHPTLNEFADAATALTDPVNAFFDDVLVMAEDPEVRATRLGLLAAIGELAGTVIDWSALGNAIGR
ncbi:MAG: glycine--tRNA ligase subunit beta, partial [Pseudonocardiaceae bacterium]